MPLVIRFAYDDLDAIRELFLEYAGMLGVDLGFQRFDEELSGLPGKYAYPDGRLYLAVADGTAAGCIALRRYDDTTCEMKRLFVRPAFRGRKIGVALVETVLSAAREIGYADMVLDSLTTLEHSLSIYRQAGFREVPPYYHNPHPDAIYLKRPLG